MLGNFQTKQKREIVQHGQREESPDLFDKPHKPIKSLL
jgi:hypothetical protein